eukprot:SAG11_NODE_856_length_6864_cov_12.741168_6_plen_58_part_00
MQKLVSGCGQGWPVEVLLCIVIGAAMRRKYEENTREQTVHVQVDSDSCQFKAHLLHH